MEDHTEDHGKQSRRTFTKSIAAALVTAPLLPLSAGAEGAEKEDSASALPGPVPAGAPSSLMFTHLPIILSSGSFQMEIRHPLIKVTSDLGGYDRYVFKDDTGNPAPLVKDIATVTVTEEAETRVKDYKFRLKHSDTPAQLWLWFQRWAGGQFDPADLDAPQPHARIMGYPFTLYLDTSFGADFLDSHTDTHKNYHPHRYRTETHEGGAIFRIGRWSIRNKTMPTQSIFVGERLSSDANGFNFDVHFTDERIGLYGGAEFKRGNQAIDLVPCPKKAKTGESKSRSRRKNRY
jgi:hypothetical protein